MTASRSWCSLFVLGAAVVLHPDQSQQAEDDGYSHCNQSHSALHIMCTPTCTTQTTILNQPLLVGRRDAEVDQVLQARAIILQGCCLHQPVQSAGKLWPESSKTASMCNSQALQGVG